MANQIVKNEKGAVRISVRGLVEFILREGDIDNRVGKTAGAQAMQEGSRIHRKIQGGMGDNYRAEVPLRLTIDQEDYQIVVEGRADGILIEDGKTMIDEIKGVYKNLELLAEPVKAHRAQAMCYAYIYALQQELDEIGVRMTYCNLDTEEIRVFEENFSFERLGGWFAALIGEYRKWADFQFAWRILRQESIKKLKFPYEYREGQKQLAADVYRTIARKKTLFIQAPTGAGKTISTIFTAVKAVGEELSDRIFYLTAKTITGSVARETFELLQHQGYQAKTIQIVAKEKLCLCDEMDCNPVHCPYAKGHYDRVNDAVFELLQTEDMITREILEEQAAKHMVCPFEMCLDTASWADNIICDYNYVFDPNVYLKRFFAEGAGGDYLFLVDEAHNLVERSRQMYSAAIYKEDFMHVKSLLKKQHQLYTEKLIRDLDRCNRILLSYKRECDNCTVRDSIASFVVPLQRLLTNFDEFFHKAPDFADRREVFEFYMNLYQFRNIYDLCDSHYVIYTEHGEENGFKLKLYCADPSANLQERIAWGTAAVFFSATFLPIQYYKSVLSTRKDNYAVYAKTSFLPEQSLILVANDVSSAYKRRGQTEYEKIAFYIDQMLLARKGNYMIFFPSYKMMQDIYGVFIRRFGQDAECILQQPGMDEAGREQFLAEFLPEKSDGREKSFAAFCVLGGIFGEGIDLKNERLIGALIVGTGLPQIGNEREILKDYYDGRNSAGFDFAYRYPGMNKVLQAGGRVIRTAEDYGVILLLDERFWHGEYRTLFPREWEERTVCNVRTVKKYLDNFWNKRLKD